MPNTQIERGAPGSHLGQSKKEPLDSLEAIKNTPTHQWAGGNKKKRCVLGGYPAQNTPKIPFLEWF
jgi:hypothetical protein